MDYTCIFFGILFTAAGQLIALGKIHKYLSVWKNIPESEKRRINILPLCRNIGEIIMLNGIIFLLKGLWADFLTRWFSAAMIAWMIVAGFDIWYISRSDRYYSK